MRVPNVLKYQFTDNFNLKVSDACCLKIKEEPLKNWQKQNGYKHKILGLMAEEGGRRSTQAKCQSFRGDSLTFNPLIKVTNDWLDWFIKTYNIELCALYYPPYNFTRTGCKGCPYSLRLAEQLAVMAQYFPEEYKQTLAIWQPVYKEYRRINYRLKQYDAIALDLKGD